MRILICGAYGLLGVSLKSYLIRRGYFIIGCRRSDYTASGKGSYILNKILIDNQIDVVVNLVALTDVDGCEANPILAYDLNVEHVKKIKNAIEGVESLHKPHLVHISTDQVYDGATGLQSEDMTKPINVYGKTKYLGERVAQEIGSSILRTNFIGRSKVVDKTSFTDWIVNNCVLQKNITVFNDVYISPLHTNILCKYIETVALKKIAGTYNLGMRGAISKAEIAFELAKYLNYNNKIFTPNTIDIANMRAKRPKNMSMDCSNFEKTFKQTMPAWEEQVPFIVSEYLNENR